MCLPCITQPLLEDMHILSNSSCVNVEQDERHGLDLDFVIGNGSEVHITRYRHVSYARAPSICRHPVREGERECDDSEHKCATSAVIERA